MCVYIHIIYLLLGKSVLFIDNEITIVLSI